MLLVITDRDELDQQIVAVMKNAGVIGADSPSPRITSRAAFVDKLAAIRKHSGEELDIKPFEADMRHLINTYIQADPATELGQIGELSLTEWIIETGIQDAIARKLNAKGRLSRNAIAEGIINNVRKTIIRDQLTDPRYYEQMSKLLDDLIRQSRADTAAYEEFLRQAEALVKRLATRQPDDGVPAVLHGKPEALVLFNNLASLPATNFRYPSAAADQAALALRIDRAMRERAPAGWYGDQARDTPRQYVERESHDLWGRSYLLSVVEADTKPAVQLDHRRITLCVRPGSTLAKRAEILAAWHRALLHALVPVLIKRWEGKLGVKVNGYFLQRMKTKWGGCSHRSGTIRLNTELVRKPGDLLEYVVVHEMLHLLEPRHGERFVALLEQHYPSWREARAELNELPLAAERWTVK